MPPMKRSARRHHGGLVVTIHQFGDKGMFGCEFLWPDMDRNKYPVKTEDGGPPAAGFTTLQEAQNAADQWLIGRGHQCDSSCSNWAPSN